MAAEGGLACRAFDQIDECLLVFCRFLQDMAALCTKMGHVDARRRVCRQKAHLVSGYKAAQGLLQFQHRQRAQEADGIDFGYLLIVHTINPYSLYVFCAPWGRFCLTGNPRSLYIAGNVLGGHTC